MKKILVVCLGNICRSPAAEGIVRDALIRSGKKEGRDFIVESAGTAPWNVGKPPDQRSVNVCRRHHIDISGHRGRQVRASDGDIYDYIFAMDEDNMTDLKNIIAPKHHRKISLFADTSIGDPYFGVMGFEKMFDRLTDASKKWITKIFYE